MVKQTVVSRIIFVFLFLLLISTLLYYDLLREFHLENLKKSQLEQQNRFRTSNEFKLDVKTNEKDEVFLENILTASKQPELGRNIFFIDTTYMRRRKHQRPFTSRQACAVESAGKKLFCKMFMKISIFLQLDKIRTSTFLYFSSRSTAAGMKFLSILRQLWRKFCLLKT